jgi:hypothetical protein
MEKKVNVFTYINAICNHEYMKVGKEYNQFMVNRFFSYFIDTINIAREGSKLSVDNQTHFKYYYGLIARKSRRVANWYKSPYKDSLKYISLYYNISYNEARNYLNLISFDEIEEIKELFKS